MSALFVPKPFVTRSLFDQARGLQTFLMEHRDLDPSGSSRVNQLVRAALRAENKLVLDGHPDLPLLLQATKDLLEFSFILSELSPAPAQPMLWTKLRRALGDASLPQDSSPNSDARDRQFELMVMAILSRSGFSPELLAEGETKSPDFRIWVGADECAVEVKRIKGLSKAATRLKEAADQLAAHGKPGYVFMDYSFAVNGAKGNLVHPKPLARRAFKEAQQKRFLSLRRRFLDPHTDELMRRNVHAICFVDTLVTPMPLRPGETVPRWETNTIRDSWRLTCLYERDARRAENFITISHQLGLPVSPD